MGFSQAIDLKTLINKPQKDAVELLDEWKIPHEMSKEYPDLIVAYREGLQIQIKNGKVENIWIEFTYRRSGAYPLCMDDVICPDTEISKIIDGYGNPDFRGNETTTGTSIPGGWLKWKKEKYQLHCEYQNGKVMMVTIMQPLYQ